MIDWWLSQDEQSIIITVKERPESIQIELTQEDIETILYAIKNPSDDFKKTTSESPIIKDAVKRGWKP